jgi:hypothetical protein
VAQLLAAFEAGRGALRLTGLVAATARSATGPPRLTRPEVRAVRVRRAALLAVPSHLQWHTSVTFPLQRQAAGARVPSGRAAQERCLETRIPLLTVTCRWLCSRRSCAQTPGCGGRATCRQRMPSWRRWQRSRPSLPTL